MSNQPQKKKSRFPAFWRSLRSRPASSSNAAQTETGPSVSPSRAPFPLTSNPSTATGQNTGAQSVNIPVSAAQKCSSTPNHPSSYPGRSPFQSLRQYFNSRLAKDYTKTTLNGAYELLKVLKESSDVFIPLKSVVGGVIACVDVYKVSPVVPSTSILVLFHA